MVSEVKLYLSSVSHVCVLSGIEPAELFPRECADRLPWK